MFTLDIHSNPIDLRVLEIFTTSLHDPDDHRLDPFVTGVIVPFAFRELRLELSPCIDLGHHSGRMCTGEVIHGRLDIVASGPVCSLERVSKNCHELSLSAFRVSATRFV